MNSARLSQSLTRALADLEAERARIEQAISRLQGVIREISAAPRGRQPSTTAKAKTKATATRNWSAASRRAAAERMRRYWAQRRKGSAAKAAAAKGRKQAAAAAKRSTKGWTPEARKAAAERMRRYWSDRAKKKDGGGKS